MNLFIKSEGAMKSKGVEIKNGETYKLSELPEDPAFFVEGGVGAVTIRGPGYNVHKPIVVADGTELTDEDGITLITPGQFRADLFGVLVTFQIEE